MVTEKEYYIAPSQQIFDEIKYASMGIWQKYDDTFGYRTEKLNRIKDMENIQDNAMSMVGMFDAQNLFTLLSLEQLSPEARKYINDRREV